jgi:hypothetical protein
MPPRAFGRPQLQNQQRQQRGVGGERAAMFLERGKPSDVFT